MKVCAIYDAKAEAWLTPLFFQAVGQALRSFGDAVNQSDSEFGKHAEDYTLFLLGDFDSQSGLLQVQAAPVALAVGSTLKRSE